MLLPFFNVDPQGISVVSGFFYVPTHSETVTIALIPPFYSEYLFTPENFVEVLKTKKKIERQLNACAKQFKPFMD